MAPVAALPRGRIDRTRRSPEIPRIAFSMQTILKSWAKTVLGSIRAANSAVRPNKGIKLSNPESLEGIWPVRSTIIEAGFAAYAQCSADDSESRQTKTA